MMKRLKHFATRFGLGRFIALLLLADLVFIRLVDPLPIEALRLRTFDLYQSLKPRVVTARPVVIVDIDEESLAAYGQWPWPRTIIADLVAELTQRGTAAIAFDVIFAEADRLSPDRVAETLRDLDPETREKLRNLPSNDQLLADTMRRARVVVGQSGFRGLVTDLGKDAGPQTALATLGGDPTPYIVTFPGLLRNLPVLEAAASGRGLLTIRPERDGIVRRLPMVMLAQGLIVPSLTLELLRVATGSDAILVKTDAAGIRSVGTARFELPTDGNGQLWIHFSPRDATRYVSAKDVLRGEVPDQRLAGKLVLIGTSAVGLLDLKATPVDPAMPGVEVHAQVLETALTQSVLGAPTSALVVELALAIIVSLAVIAFAPRLGAAALFFSGGTVALLLAGLSWYYYDVHRLLLDATFPWLSSFLVYATVVLTNYMRSQTDRRRIRSAFKQYLSPSLVQELERSPEKLVLGGEERMMTVMFSDIRGFTTISEQYKSDPKGLTALMNRFLTPLTNAILHRSGTIDKYMGDAIMAFWNAPLDDPQQEINACLAALDMLKCLAALNAEREAEARAASLPFLPLQAGIGINTGHCVVGNMGSDLRFDYSVLGDSVNLASRLEGQTKVYRVPVIVGSHTAQAARARFALLELDLIAVKGKTEPDVIYSLLGDEEVLRSREFRNLSDINQLMMTAYRAGDWDGALDAIDACRVAAVPFGMTATYDMFHARILGFIERPPGGAWNGIYMADQK